MLTSFALATAPQLSELPPRRVGVVSGLVAGLTTLAIQEPGLAILMKGDGAFGFAIGSWAAAPVLGGLTGTVVASRLGGRGSMWGGLGGTTVGAASMVGATVGTVWWSWLSGNGRPAAFTHVVPPLATGLGVGIGAWIGARSGGRAQITPIVGPNGAAVHALCRF